MASRGTLKYMHRNIVWGVVRGVKCFLGGEGGEQCAKMVAKGGRRI